MISEIEVPAKASSPMLFRDSGNISEVMPSHVAKALLAISVRFPLAAKTTEVRGTSLKAEPPMETNERGNVREESDVPIKAQLPIDVRSPFSAKFSSRSEKHSSNASFSIA